MTPELKTYKRKRMIREALRELIQFSLYALPFLLFAATMLYFTMVAL